MLGPGFAQKVIEEVNKIRLNPKTYSTKIKGYLSYFQGNVLRIPKQQGLMTNEGPTAYREAADFLLTLPKLQPLTADEALTSAAQEMATELSHYDEFEQMDGINRDNILEKYGHYEGQFGESTDFGSMSPEMVVINLLVDDGNKSRANRKMLFKETYRKIGCGCSPHNTYKSVTVLMFATNFIRGGNTGKAKLIKTNKTTLSKGENREQTGPGYVKDIRTEQDVQNSGIPYRYVNNVDPNKDLITDSAKYGDKINFQQEQEQSGTQSINPNYRQKLDLSGKGTTKVGGGGSILNTNVESSGWTPSLQNTDYVKARQKAQQDDLNNNQYRVKLPNAKETKVGGGGSILNTNVESSGWAPGLQKNYRPPQQQEENNYMQKLGQNTKTTKVGGGGSILNTNVESSGWVTDFEKQKSPEYWRAKQEYQDNYKGMAPIGPAIGNIGGGGAIGNSNVESGDWNDYSGYERRMPYYHEEKRYEAPNKEERIYGQQKPKFQEEKIYGQQQQPKYQEEREDPNFPDMTGVAKVEQSEKIINEGGKKVKIIKLVKYMENGEVKTEISKVKI